MKTRTDPEIPHITAAQMAKATPFLKRRGRGRPRGTAKSMVSIRIDNDVYSWLKKSGPGYQSRINSILRQMYEMGTGGRA
jgi:uncharacterized protein (DUF4415 family)